MSLYWLSFRRDGRFAGAAMFEAQAAIEARLKAELAGIGEGFDCEVLEPSATAQRQIPRSMIGRMLSLEEIDHLEAAISPNKPPAPSVRRGEPRKQSAAT